MYLSKTTMMAAAVAAIVATSASAQDTGLPPTGFTFDAFGDTFGNVDGFGSAGTTLDGFKTNNFNVTADLTGVCISCLGAVADAVVDVGETAGLEMATSGDTSDTEYGNSGMIDLGARGFIGGDDGGFGFRAGSRVNGHTFGYGVGDEVTFASTNNQGAETGGRLTFNGSPCEVLGTCDGDDGTATEGSFANGFANGTTAVTARGINNLSIGNSSNGAVNLDLRQLFAVPQTESTPD